MSAPRIAVGPLLFQRDALLGVHISRPDGTGIAGLSRADAEQLHAWLGDVLGEPEPLCQELTRLRDELAKSERLRADLDEITAEARTELNTEIEALRAELETVYATIGRDFIERLRRAQEDG